MKNLPRWTRLITEEFYLQGDEEKKRGLKVSVKVLSRYRYLTLTNKIFSLCSSRSAEHTDI